MEEVKLYKKFKWFMTRP